MHKIKKLFLSYSPSALAMSRLMREDNLDTCKHHKNTKMAKIANLSNLSNRLAF